jgi:hypothetical protein
MTSTLPKGTLGSVASLLAATLHQGNPDRFLVLCVCFVDCCLSFCTFFFLAIVLSVLFQYTDSDYLYGILKLFLANCCLLVIAVKCFCTVLM